VAKYIRQDSYALVFGVNFFLALVLQTILTFVVIEQLEFNARDQVSQQDSYLSIENTIYFCGLCQPREKWNPGRRLIKCRLVKPAWLTELLVFSLMQSIIFFSVYYIWRILFSDRGGIYISWDHYFIFKTESTKFKPIVIIVVLLDEKNINIASKALR